MRNTTVRQCIEPVLTYGISGRACGLRHCRRVFLEASHTMSLPIASTCVRCATIRRVLNISYRHQGCLLCLDDAEKQGYMGSRRGTGTSCLVTLAMEHHLRICMQFDPSRWLDDRLQKHVLSNPFNFVPFNAGMYTRTVLFHVEVHALSRVSRSADLPWSAGKPGLCSNHRTVSLERTLYPLVCVQRNDLLPRSLPANIRPHGARLGCAARRCTTSG